MPTDDAKLVSRVIGGERDAYADLVRRHQDLVYRHMRGMGIDHDTSLDLVQDAFVRAYDRLAECRNRVHFRAWLFRIARNLCLDHLKNVRRSTLPLSTLAGAEDIQDRREDTSELDLTMRVALEQLPAALREAFLLKHDAGYTYEEVAEMTDASPSAVKMRVHRARETLRQFLTDQGVTAA
ncbi:MAG TPA: RNA polymerase sigma factor [Longimicrobiales bacterium]|nr:RNA polymerase sigma factor [Longimicrobiales bacterium]